MQKTFLERKDFSTVDEHYSSLGFGRRLHTIEAILFEARISKLPVRIIASKDYTMLGVTVEDGRFQPLEEIHITADRDGFITGWTKDFCGCVADHARISKRENGDYNLSFFQESMIVGYLTIPAAEKYEKMSLLSSGVKITSFLTSCGVLPSISIDNETMTMEFKTAFDELATLSFSRMGTDFVIDTLTVNGEEMKAYGLDTQRSFFTGWGAMVKIKVANGNMKTYKKLAIGVPGSEKWLSKEVVEILG